MKAIEASYMLERKGNVVAKGSGQRKQEKPSDKISNNIHAAN
jgi:hypothetical protein